MEQFKEQWMMPPEMMECKIIPHGVLQVTFSVPDHIGYGNKDKQLTYLPRARNFCEAEQVVQISLKEYDQIDDVCRLLLDGLMLLRNKYLKPITLSTPEKEDKNFSYVPVEIQEYFAKKKDVKDNEQ